MRKGTQILLLIVGIIIFLLTVAKGIWHYSNVKKVPYGYRTAGLGELIRYYRRRGS